MAANVSTTRLPIDVIPATHGGPLRFKWQYLVSTIAGDGHRVQECEGALPASVERAVESVITIAKQALMDNAVLRGQVEAAQLREDQRQREMKNLAQQRVAAAEPIKKNR